MTRARLVTLVLAAALVLPATARAEPAVGVLAGTNVLAGFDTNAPGTLLHLAPITGLGASERVPAVDYRYHTLLDAAAPGLLALGVTRSGSDDALRLYTLDPDTGAATALGAPVMVATPAGAVYGIDINPFADRVRVVNSHGLNLRLNPFNSSLTGMDSPVTPPGSQLTALAYDRVHLPTNQTPTTLWAVAGATSQFGTIGGPDGVPSANGGVFTARGPIGVTLDPGSLQELDIAPGGAAYLSAAAGGVQTLYTLDLASGAATALGAAAMPLSGLAVLPAATISFDATSVSATESAGAATLTLTRSGDTAPAVSATWTASTGASGVVGFAAGQTSAAIAVPIAADALDEPDQTVTVTLSRPSFHGALGSAGVTLVIVDDDPSPDRAAPRIALGGVPRSVTYARLLARGIRVSTTADEAVAIEATLLGTTRRARLSAFNVALATRRLPLAAGTRTATLKPKRRALQRPRRTVKLRVRVVATDAAGNRATARQTVRLKPR